MSNFEKREAVAKASTVPIPGVKPAETKGASGVSRRNLLMGAAIAGGSAVAASAATLAGTGTLGTVIGNVPLVSARPTGKLREYWIQADSFQHNLVPTGKDGLMGMTFKANQSSYWAIGYRAYTPGWGKPLAGNSDIGENSGIPGPILRASVGDTLRVHFRNNDTHYNYAHSVHPHGVFYTPNNDGGWFAADPRPGAAVQVHQSYTYEWQVHNNSVGTWVYHDHSLPVGKDMTMELGAELGLFGFIVLTDNTTTAVDREIFTFLHDLYQDDVPTLSQDYDCFNGASYVGNTPTYGAHVGEKVRWHVGALGKEFHVFHVHGHRWPNGNQTGNRFTDTLLLGPSMASYFEFVEDNPGKWLYHCHVTDHMMGGMAGLYNVTQ